MFHSKLKVQVTELRLKAKAKYLFRVKVKHKEIGTKETINRVRVFGMCPMIVLPRYREGPCKDHVGTMFGPYVRTALTKVKTS